MRKIFALLITVSFFSQAFSQLTISPDVHICSGSTVLSVLTEPSHATDAYTVDSIPFTSESHAGTNAFTAVADDNSTLAKSIGFPFCFFGNTYNDVYINPNGWISFSSPSSSWGNVYGPGISFGDTAIFNLPDTTSKVPKNCIMGPWQDWYPSSCFSCIELQTLGTAPYRRFVVSYQDVQLFSCEIFHGDFQIVLYETTNIIENHIIDKPDCTAWEGGLATQAIHNIDGTQSVEVEGRDATAWAASNESWRYTPAQVEWYKGPELIGTGNSLSVSPETTTTYTASVKSCGGTIYTDDVTVYVDGPLATITPSGPVSFCTGSSVILNASAGAGFSYQWKRNGINIPGATSSVFTANVTGQYQVYIANGICNAISDSLSVVKNAKPNPTITNVDATNDLCFDAAIKLKTAAVTGGSYQWYKGAAAITGATANVYLATITGNYKVKVTNSAGCFKLSSPYMIIKTCKLGDEEIGDDISINIYPNPNNGIFTLELSAAEDEFMSISIKNLIGEEIYSEQINTSELTHIINPDKNIPDGMYLVYIQTDNKIFTKQIIIAK